MKPSKNTFTLVLMISGMVLLLTLQALWLQSAYKEALADFRRKAFFHFQHVVMAMQDSVLIRNMEPVRVDSFLHIMNGGLSLSEKRERNDKPDSLPGFSRIQVVVQSPHDSLKDNIIYKSIAPGIRGIRRENRKGLHQAFIIKIGPDTLNIDSLSTRYRRELGDADIKNPFTIRYFRTSPDEIPRRLVGLSKNDRHPEQTSEEKYSIAGFSGDSIQIRYKVEPTGYYTASLTKVRSYLAGEIMPQILFSLLLTLVIATAFILMYRSIRSQQKLMEIKNDFISNITHELKTPVATVSVAIEALKNFRALDNPELTREYLDIAQNELNRLTLMTDKILKTSFFERGEMDFHTEKVDLEKMIRQILASMKLVFEKKNARVTFEREGTDFEMDGSPVHLTNMVYNLIDNSLKYSSENPEVRILLKSIPEQLMLSVKDSGVGIPAEYQKKIFEKFFRVPTGDVHNAKGHGLGLSYVAAIVKKHKGTISVESIPGQGSCFTVALPKRID